MDSIELLTTRASNARLSEPAPDATTLELAFEAAARAPDHAGLRPWRIRLVRGAARERLGQLMTDAVLKANPRATSAQLEKTAAKVLRAPLIIVVGAAVTPHPKVPELEQLLSAGAAAHAILLMLHARGYAGIWRTGGAAYDPALKTALGFATSDAIVGFIYCGTATQATPDVPRVKPELFVSDWTGDR